MFPKSLIQLKFWLSLVIVIGLGSSSLFAGWLGFRNDTKDQLVVQETTVVNNVARPGKPQSLNSGDVVRDSQVCPANQRKFTIYDAKGNAIHTGMFPCPGANENILNVIKLDAKGNVTIEAVTFKK